MQVSPESLLPINEPPSDTPPWVSKFLGYAACVFQRSPGRYVAVLFHLVGLALAALSAVEAAQAVGLAHSGVCAVRACLFWELSCLMIFCDFCSMLYFSNSQGRAQCTATPCTSARSRCTADSAHRVWHRQ